MTRLRRAAPEREPFAPPAPRLRLPATALPREPHPRAPWPLNESELDLPDEPPPPPPLPTPEDRPFYLGSVTVTQRGIPGPFTLDLLLAVDGSQLDLGPFTLDRKNLVHLDQLMLIAHALLGYDRHAPLDAAPAPPGSLRP